MTDLRAQLEKIVGAGGLVEQADLKTRMGWPPYQCAAAYLARPADSAQVAAVLAACHAAGQSVVTHGGRTGLAGGAISQPGDIVLSLERFNRIEEIDVAGRTMTLGAGVVLEAAQKAAADAGLMLAADWGARGSATIGGGIATNAGGNQVLRYGMMREQVLGLEAVLADGTVVSSMNRMLKNNAGYDLKQLFIGTEGTLGIVTRAVLRLRAAPAETYSALAACADFDAVAALLDHMDRRMSGALAAYEVMWRDFYDLVHGAVSPPPLPPGHAFYVLVEAAGQGDADAFEAALGEAIEQDIVADAVLAQSGRERDAFWAVRDNIPALMALAPIRTYDVSMPLSAMGDYVADVRGQLQAELGIARVAVFGHVGDGNIHIILGLEDATPDRAHAADTIVYDRLVPIGGSVSAEHGVGVEKRPFLDRSRSAAEIALMRQLKTALDPKNILNPGKVI
ncbi:MAG: FAD-binding oxidoreductase [Sphingomonadales bacterium]